MITLNLAPRARRSCALTVAADFARAARLTRLARRAAWDAIDAIETAADIAVEVINHERYCGRRVFPLQPSA